MSIRAYKIERIETSKSPTFNLLHCPDELEELLLIFERLDDTMGFVEIQKADVLTAIQESNGNDTKKILKDILKDIGEDDYVQYRCY